jgi:hypothetical protein
MKEKRNCRVSLLKRKQAALRWTALIVAFKTSLNVRAIRTTASPQSAGARLDTVSSEYVLALSLSAKRAAKCFLYNTAHSDVHKS